MRPTERDIKIAILSALFSLALGYGLRSVVEGRSRPAPTGAYYSEITLAVGAETGHTGKDDDGVYRDLFIFESEAQASVARQKVLGALADFRVELFRQK